MASVKKKVVKSKAVKPKSVKPKAPAKKTVKIAKPAIKTVKAVSTPIATKQNESQIMKVIAEETELKLADIKAVFASLHSLLSRHMKKKGSGEFKFPKLGVKVRRIKKPATKARMGRNPATGEEIKIPAKPARSVVRASALKALKEMIDQ